MFVILNLFHGSKDWQKLQPPHRAQKLVERFLLLLLQFLYEKKKVREKAEREEKSSRMTQIALFSKSTLAQEQAGNLPAKCCVQVLGPLLLSSGAQTQHMPHKEAGLGRSALDSICLPKWNYIQNSKLWLMVWLRKRKVFKSDIYRQKGADSIPGHQYTCSLGPLPLIPTPLWDERLLYSTIYTLCLSTARMLCRNSECWNVLLVPNKLNILLFG